MIKTEYEIYVEGFMTRDIQEKHPLPKMDDLLGMIKFFVNVAQDNTILAVYRCRAIEYGGKAILKSMGGN